MHDLPSQSPVLRMAFSTFWATGQGLEPGARVLWAPAPTSLQPILYQALVEAFPQGVSLR